MPERMTSATYAQLFMLMATMPAAKREKLGIHEISGIFTPIMGRP